jgi:hypothetical protein
MLPRCERENMLSYNTGLTEYKKATEQVDDIWTDIELR